MNRIKRQLDLQLTLIFLILILASSGIIAYLLHDQSVKALENEAYQSLKEMARASGNEINIEISNAMRITEMLSELVNDNFDINRLQTDPQYISNLILQFDPFFRNIAENMSIATSAYVYYNWELDGAAHDIYYIDHDNDGFVSRQDQLPVAYFKSMDNPRGSKSWWYGPIASKEPFWSSPYEWFFDDGTSTQFISYTKAVFQDNRLIAVVGTDFKYENLLTILKDLSVYQTGYPILIDNNQQLLVHPVYHGQLLSTLNSEPFISLYNAHTDNHDQVITYRGVDGNTWLLSHFKLLNGWTLAITAPLTEVTGSARAMALRVLSLWSFFIPLFLLVSLFTARRIIRPIHELTETVASIGVTGYTPSINPDILIREDEIGTLGAVIGKMGLTIEENIQEILQKSQALEFEMSQKNQVQMSFELVYEAFVAAQNGMIITDDTFKILHANPAFARLLEIQGQTEGLSLEKCLSDLSTQNQIFLKHDAFSHQQIIIASPGFPKRYLWLILTRVESKDGQYQFIGVLEDQTESIHQSQSIEYLKDHDGQTGLLSKNAALQLIQQHIGNDDHSQAISALLIMNIDDFRLINEAMGYDCGDTVITEIAKRIKRLLQEECILARTAGDEFLVFCQSVSYLQEIEHLALEMLSMTKQAIQWKNNELFVTLSIGVSIYPFDTTELNALYNYAVTALNNAKSTGKNLLRFYSQEMAERAFERYELSNQLREALDKDEFFLVYQPILTLDDQSIQGVEALIRWQHPQKGLISPDRFIPLAEANGSIDPIGLWVIERACHQLRIWIDQAIGIQHIAINLSTLQLNSSGFSHRVLKIVEGYNLSPNQVNLEITESALILQNSIASDNLSRLKNFGFHIHIDDFGTGFSSLSYLRDFRIDVLKIDRTFIKNIPDSDTGDIARLIIDLSNSLGIKVIGEGVETLGQLHYLASHGCDYIQGYYISPPLPADDMTKFLVAYTVE